MVLSDEIKYIKLLTLLCFVVFLFFVVLCFLLFSVFVINMKVVYEEKKIISSPVY